MPIHEIGYRIWDGPLRARAWRWLTLTRTGIALAMRSKMARRIAFLSLAQVLYLGPVFFVIGAVTGSDQEVGGPFARIARAVLDAHELASLRTNPDSVRGPIWNDIFLYLQSNVQLLVSIVLATIVAPPLISQDLRSKAFLLYFSKPINRFDYVFGKASVLLGLLLYLTLLPSVVVYILSIAVSPTGATIAQTAGVIPAFFAGALVIVVPITAVSLFLSSVTSEERIAMFAWIAIVVGGHFTHLALSNLPGVPSTDALAMMSLPASIEAVISGLYDTPNFGPKSAQFREVMGQPLSATFHAVWLTVLSSLCFFGVWRRISAPIQQ